MLARFCTPCVTVFWALLVSCSSGSTTGGSAGSASETAGRSGGLQSAGTSANGGGGATGVGGTLGTAGRDARAGNAAIGGAGSNAGMGHEAGAPSSSGGRAGTGSGGVTAAGAGGGGPAPTFTRIYEEIITPSCGGARCHLEKPTPYGYDFSTKRAASAAWRADVIAGDGANSPMFQVLNFGIMPKDQAQLPVEKLYLVLDWINAGALDD